MLEVTISGWMPDEWAEIERAARNRGISAKQYVIHAVREQLENVPDPMEPVFHRRVPRIKPPTGMSSPEPTASGPDE